MNKEEIKKQCCPNKDCKNYSLVEHGNIAVHDSNKNRFRCKLCGKTWVIHCHEFHFGLRTKIIKINRAVDMIKANLPIRTIARFSKISPSTAMRWKKKLVNCNNTKFIS